LIIHKILKEFPGVRKHIHDLDISLTEVDSSEDGIWDLKLTMVCDSLKFDNDTNIATQYQSLDQLLKRKMAVYDKVLAKVDDCFNFLCNVQIFAFTEEMWKYRTYQKKEWDAFERAKKERNSAIIKDMSTKLEEACKSDSISVGLLQETTKMIPTNLIAGSCFLHQACLNKNVTLEVIEYLLDYHPKAANIDHTYTWYKDWRMTKKAYPLHMACINETCSDSVIQFLVEANPAALTEPCHLNQGNLDDGIFYNDYSEDLSRDPFVSGSPLHYYLSRDTNINVELVRFFVTASPDVLTAADEKSKCTPMHLLSSIKNMDELIDIMQYIVETNPSCLDLEDNWGRNALHNACSDAHVTARIVQLFIDHCPDLLHRSYDDGYYGATYPIQCLCRNKKLSIQTSTEIVSIIIKAYPEALLQNDLTPIHLLSEMQNVDELFDIIQYSIQTNPSCLDLLDGQKRNALHVACSNAYVTSRIVQLFIDHCPDLLHRSYEEWNGTICFPIHCLCENLKLSIQTSTEIVSIIIKAFPEALHRNESEGYPSPIHYALKWNCPNTEFCKMLIEQHPECASEVEDNTLPIHKACHDLDLVKLLFKIYPESISMRSDTGMMPIHYAAAHGNVELLQFLLDHDATSASTIAEVPEDGYSHYEASYDGGDTIPFPLLFACCTKDESSIRAVKLLYNYHPEAIYLREWEWGDEEEADVGVLSDYYASQCTNNEPTVAFLDSQAEFARNAKDVDVMMTLDNNGWLPLHHACENGASLGSIKLLVYANPAAVQVATTHEGLFPLHIACRSSTVDVVEFLLERYAGRLNLCDARGDYPLHFACRRGGNYSIVNCLLRQPSAPVLERNVDNEMPMDLLLNAIDDENNDVKETPEYIETLWHMLLLFPESVVDVEYR